MYEKNSLQKEWIYKEYVNRENLIVHAPFEPEMDFYLAVTKGDMNKVKGFLNKSFTSMEGLGKLSDNIMHHFRYHFVITTAVIARYCIQAGLSLEEAYSLSDFYIQKADKASTTDEIDILHDEMAIDYTRKMNKLKAVPHYSKPVIECINYIYSNLHTRITLPELAERVMLSPSYLSKLFKKETGLSISNYISHQKIETAKNMLLYSSYSPGEIAQILDYPSQSYFTEVFRKATGTTPGQFSHQ